MLGFYPAIGFGGGFFDAKNDHPKISNTQEGMSLQFRPHAGVGIDGSIHAGFRLMMHAGETQSYGLEFTKFKTTNDQFLVAGIILEQKRWDWFTASIGTLGYFHYGADDQNVIGLASNLGWEPDTTAPIKPYITYRNDTIFAKKKIKSIHSVSAGLKFKFEF